MSNYNRGGVYYVEAGSYFGSEQRAGRPAVIVSNDRNNEHSATVEIVYFTTKDKRDLPTHVSVGATGIPSTAICEQVHTMDKQRLRDFCGTCTKQEMQNIDIALMISLGLDFLDVSDSEHEESEEPDAQAEELPIDSPELIAAKAQLAILREMYDKLLKSTMEVAAR